MREKLYISVYSCIWWHARSISYFIIVFPVEINGFCRISWILTALKRIDTMFHWSTVGMPVTSFSWRVFCDQRMEDCLKTEPTKPALMTEYTPWFSSVPLMSSNWWAQMPIKGPMEDAGVIKLYEPSPTPCLYVADIQNMVGRGPLIPLFLVLTRLQQSLTCSARARI